MSEPPDSSPAAEERIAERVLQELRPLLERSGQTGEEERESLKDAQWTRRQRRRCDRWEALVFDGMLRPALALVTASGLAWLGWQVLESLRGVAQ